MVISLTSPLLVGIYEDKLVENTGSVGLSKTTQSTMIESVESYEKTSDILPLIFKNILETYKIKNLYYATGPGSFMAIKITYIFLRTLSIVNNIELFGSIGFNFNQNSPIKANGSKYFILNENNSDIELFNFNFIEENNIKINNFMLPKILDKNIFSKNNKPLYVLPAV